jgi:hypothetical protein
MPLIPPTTAPPLPPAHALPVTPLHPITRDTGLVIGIAAVSHSGRVRDAAVMAALGWVPGDRIAVDLSPNVILLRRDRASTHQIDGRGLVYLPAGSRALLGIADNARLVLVAVPANDLLAVYPCAAVSALLAATRTELNTMSPPQPTPTRRPRPRSAPSHASATTATHLPLAAIQPDTP